MPSPGMTASCSVVSTTSETSDETPMPPTPQRRGGHRSCVELVDGHRCRAVARVLVGVAVVDRLDRVLALAEAGLRLAGHALHESDRPAPLLAVAEEGHRADRRRGGARGAAHLGG